MQDHQDTIVNALMKQLIQSSPNGMAQMFIALFDLALQMEHERFPGSVLGAGHVYPLFRNTMSFVGLADPSALVQGCRGCPGG